MEHYPSPSTSWEAEAARVRRIAVIDVMNFLHSSASSQNKPRQSREFLDALDLAAFMLMLLQREFDVRAVVPRSISLRIRNGFLFEIFNQLGLVIFTESSYDDLLVIRYAAETGAFIVSDDKYRDVLKLDVTDAEKYVIHHRVIRPTINPFQRAEGESYALMENGDRVVNFVGFLYASKPEALYADPQNPDYARCIHERERFTLTRLKALRTELVHIFDFVDSLEKAPQPLPRISDARKKLEINFRRESLQRFRRSVSRKSAGRSYREQVVQRRREEGDEE
uniref:RNase_Zc3h12a domain-containing protein n=1 Tax=Steinernema glaseri TaxID=37863 RepID=A0A1I7ZVE3_9BILA